MVVTTRSRKGAAAPGLEPNELTNAHMASARPVTGTTDIPKASKLADRSAPGYRRSDLGWMGIPGAFSQNPVPNEPEPSSDEQEEDWVSDAVTEAAEARIRDDLGNRDGLNPSEVSDEEVGDIPTNSEPSEVASEMAERQDEPRPARRPASMGPSFSGYSRNTAGSGGRINTPITPSFLAEAEATAHPGARSTTPFQTPSRIARAPVVRNTQGSIHGPKYFSHALEVQYGEIHDEKDDEKMEGGSDETLRQTRYKRKSEAQQHAEDMALLRDIISNNRRLQRIRATLPDMIPNNKSLLEEISEMLPEAVSGNEYDWEMKDPTPEASRTSSTREQSIKEATPPSIIEGAPTYFQKGKWVSNDEHDARVAYKQASQSGAKPNHRPKKARPSMGITIDEIRPMKSPHSEYVPDKTNDLRASITILPAGGFFADRMRARYENSETTPTKKENQPERSRSNSLDSDGSSDPSSSSSETESSSEDEKSKHKRQIRKLKKKLRKSRKTKVMPKDPAPYKGEDNMDIFEKWDFETEFWIAAHKMSDTKALGHMCSFLDGKAAQWYMDFITPEPQSYTVDSMKMALFSYCFPSNIKEILRREFKFARQGKHKFIDYLRTLKRYQRRLPDITDRQLCHKLWDTAHRYIKVKWIEAGMDSEHTDLKVLSDAAERYEKAEGVLKQTNYKHNQTGNSNSNHKGRDTHASGEHTESEAQDTENSYTSGTESQDGSQSDQDKSDMDHSYDDRACSVHAVAPATNNQSAETDTDQDANSNTDSDNLTESESEYNTDSDGFD